MITLMGLFWLLFRLGILTFGSGLTIIPLIQREMYVRGLMTMTESADIIAIAEMTPGPFAVNASTFVGMRLYGIPGAVVATTGMILPSFILGIIAARFLFAFRDSKALSAALKGVKPATVALIASAGVTTAIANYFPEGFAASLQAVDLPVVLISVICFILLIKTKISPIFIILAVGILSGFILPMF